MPMNEEVRKAVEWADKRLGLKTWDGDDTHWSFLRAELTRLTEIADQYDPLVVRLHDVTTKLEAANAFLRECHCYFEARGVDSRTIGESLSLNEKIQAHLSENGHAQQRAGGWRMKLRTTQEEIAVLAGKLPKDRWLHDAACARALMQAMDEDERQYSDSAAHGMRERADAILKQWGFDSGEESNER